MLFYAGTKGQAEVFKKLKFDEDIVRHMMIKRGETLRQYTEDM